MAGGAAIAVVALIVRAVGADADARARLTADEERAVSNAWRTEGLSRLGGERSDDVARVITQGVAGFGRMLEDQVGPRGVRAIVVQDMEHSDIFALPDGTLVVTAGLLSKTRSQAGFMALVAHATAHVVLGHTASAIAPVAQTLRGASSTGSASVVERTLTPVLHAPFSADDEQAADAFVTQAMTTTGWDASTYAPAMHAVAAAADGWGRQHGVDEGRLSRIGAIESNGRSGEADYRSTVLIPLGAVPAVAPTAPAASPSRDDDEERRPAQQGAAAAPPVTSPASR